MVQDGITMDEKKTEEMVTGEATVEILVKYLHLLQTTYILLYSLNSQLIVIHQFPAVSSCCLENADDLYLEKSLDRAAGEMWRPQFESFSMSLCSYSGNNWRFFQPQQGP